MKIIAGNLGGRRFNAPRGNRTHPMSDKVRGALFNSLGSLTGMTVLDAYAGSGALGFEAISRGALFATLIDNDKKAFFTMKENAAILGLNDMCKITRANISSWLNNNADKKFTIIFFDPPFDKLQLNLLARLCEHLEQNGQLVLSLAGRQEIPTLKNMVLINHKNYGDAQLVFYRFAS